MSSQRFIARHSPIESEASDSLPVLTLYTKQNCALCEEAKRKLEPYFKYVRFEEVDIEAPSNKKYFGLYRYEIPVFHLNGSFLMKNKGISTQLLESKLCLSIKPK